MKRSSSRRTGPASFKRTRSISARAIQKASTVAAPKRRRVELKRAYGHPLALSGSLAVTGALNWLPRIAAGSESDEREGRAVQIKGWEVRGIVTPNPNTGVGLFRVIVFRWKQAESGLPAVGDILYDPGTGAAIHWSYNIDQAANYDILQDKIYNCNPRVLVSGGANFDPWTEYVHLYGKVDFTQTYTGTTLTTVTDQALCVMILPEASNQSADLFSSVSFIDI